MNTPNNISASASLPSADFSLSDGQPLDAIPLAAAVGRPSSGKSALGDGDRFTALAETLLRKYRNERRELQKEKNWKDRPWKRGKLNALNQIISDLNFYSREPSYAQTDKEYSEWKAQRDAQWGARK